MGLPVGGPKTNGEGNDSNSAAWDDDDSDAGADVESDADDNFNTKVLPRRIRSLGLPSQY